MLRATHFSPQFKRPPNVPKSAQTHGNLWPESLLVSFLLLIQHSSAHRINQMSSKCIKVCTAVWILGIAIQWAMFCWIELSLDTTMFTQNMCTNYLFSLSQTPFSFLLWLPLFSCMTRPPWKVFFVSPLSIPNEDREVVSNLRFLSKFGKLATFTLSSSNLF